MAAIKSFYPGRTIIHHYNHPSLQDNRDIAERRLKNVTKNLRKENLLADYDAIINNWLNEEIIETVPLQEVSERGYFFHIDLVLKKELRLESVLFLMLLPRLGIHH